jgi:hypothetical protein
MKKEYENKAEKQKAYRERKARMAAYAEKFKDAGVNDPVFLTDEAHPVYPELKRWANREYDAKGLVLKKQHCGKCGGDWSASVEIECPYCHGHGKRKEAA